MERVSKVQGYLSVTYLQRDLIDITDYVSSGRVENDGSGRKTSNSEFLLVNVFFSHEDAGLSGRAKTKEYIRRRVAINPEVLLVGVPVAFKNNIWG